MIYKHIVVVHGIGDQKRFETMFGFVNEFLRAFAASGRKFEVEKLVPDLAVMMKAVKAGQHVCPGQPAHIRLNASEAVGFSEVYWQDIINDLLDEDGAPVVPVFKWAHSINTRFVSRGGHDGDGWRMAIDNMESILTLSQRIARLTRQDDQFQRVLNRVLGDVQMYAESLEVRTLVNTRFHTVLRQVREQAREVGAVDGSSVEIHVVSHSEGTVVAFRSLVEGACLSEEPDRWWFERVKTLVTLGSPLDKHHAIWPATFPVEERIDPRARKIDWYNYWDTSDPVAYGLAALEPHNPRSNAAKLFRVRFDRGFSRYWIPGLAHVKYWTDKGLQHELAELIANGQVRQHIGSGVWMWFQKVGDTIAYLFLRAVLLAGAGFLFAKLIVSAAPDIGRQLNTLWTWTAAGGVAAITVAMDGWWAEKPWSKWPLRIITIPALVASAGPWLLRGDVKGVSEMKDVVGIVSAIALTILVWMLHTRLHRGLVQLWRYTTGVGSGCQANYEKPLAQRTAAGD